MPSEPDPARPAREPGPDGAPGRAPVSALTRLAAAGALVEAAALAVVAVLGTVRLLTAGGGDPLAGVAVFLVVFAAATAVVLVLAARGVRRGSPRARGPLVTWQLLQAATAVAVLQAATQQTPAVVRVLGWAALVLSVAVTAAAVSRTAGSAPGR